MARTFLSYSHEDQAFVEKLHSRLKRDGVECFFDKESIKWGDNFVLALEKGIAECDIIVVVLTPDYCKSEWSNVERTAAMVDDPAAVKRRIRPLLRRKCDALPPFLKTANYIDVTTDALFDKQYPRICRDLGGSPRQAARGPAGATALGFHERPAGVVAAPLSVRERRP